MTLSDTYNFDRSYDERRKRYLELDDKRCSQEQAKYVVLTNRDAYYGRFDSDRDAVFFTNKRTAIAWAQHYSDIADNVAGIFKMPEFVGGVSCR